VSREKPEEPIVRVLLVNLPWASIDVPSLALGILRQSVLAAIPGARVDVLHANLDYVDWIADKVEFTVADYHYYSLDSYFLGCGDWVFAGALYGSDTRTAEFERYLTGKNGPDRPDSSTGRDSADGGADGARVAATRALRKLAPEFVRHLAERIVAAAPDVVGFTTTFQQNTAALATARAVKALAPRIVTVLGGANCDGDQGAALHRNFPFLDFVVRGEGEAVFPELLRALAEDDARAIDDPPDGDHATDARLDDDHQAWLARIPGLCRRAADGMSVANPMSARPLPPGEIVAPDFDGFLERLGTSTARTWVEPKLVVEGARGCWWGEKHHCTFCGLNGSFMEFRSKSPARLYDEIIDLVRRYQVLDVFLVDNILDMTYLDSLLPRLADSGHDVRLQVEIKSNLRASQLRALRDAGMVSVQPGVESLSGRVLALMDKGVTGCHNVRLLRDAESTGLTVLWNYLYGFPGERAEDYTSIIEQLPALHHLPPPAGATRIEIERFSPYFDRPELGFAELRPAPQYELIYQLPERELYDLAYLFTAPRRGIGAGTSAALEEALTEWERAYPRSRLVHWDLGTEIVLADAGRRFEPATPRLTDPVEIAAFRLLDQPRTVAGLVGRIPDASADTMTALLRRWREEGIVFTDGGRYIHVACAATNSELLRIDPAENRPC
jgi:ribosomal peptide maturation radical SAM protein 1